ncbi:MAG: hypothetical protein U5K81_07095 [Trueperaceae bacterium]|nr:hypothetical protein [Trueperaceae bacterium]
MERVTFLVEATGQRLGCLLNPATLTLTRRAGVRSRSGAAGAIASRGLSDDPLIDVGGGVTELELDLLFDVGVAGSTVVSLDVRDLTRPLWDLAETHARLEGGRPPVVQFFWGEREGFPGVVLAVAERLERFDAEGVAGRSWLRMRLRRMAHPGGPRDRSGTDPLDGIRTATRDGAGGDGTVVMGPLAGGAAGAGNEGERPVAGVSRLDAVAALHFGDATLWRWIAEANALDDPARVDPDTRLRLPSLRPGGEERP